MASLVEELVSILTDEKQLYMTLVEYGDEKRRILINGDVPALEELTVKEQKVSDELVNLGKKQVATLNDIATVLGKEGTKLTVTNLIDVLGNQPDVQKQLIEARDTLLEAAEQMQKINSQNEVLIKQAIELTEFDITLFKSMRQAPETANYNKSAYNTGSLLGSSGFDAKQ